MAAAGSQHGCGEGDAGRHVPLKVLPSRPIRRSRMGWKRATVLVLVHVVFAVHIAHWYVSGMRTGEHRTLSPIEPSESMFTLELGAVNAGFVFFALAILSTLIFGRFFCGWGCHIVALQDLCGWFMKKLGIHPKPFRTRLLMLMPLVLGGYMFVWPTLYREAVGPAITSLGGYHALESFGAFIGETPLPRPVPRPEFYVEDFFRTFGAWYVAIPFLLICGFATVYFLGSKGFCTYGCPYGGLFGPTDAISVGKIVVNDRCHQCGHCTAVCTSNVRVHEEVRDFGMVVDPGCMKCLDCVSVCPNDALSFSFAKPSVLARPRDAAAKERRAKHRKPYDLSWGEEVFFGLLFVWLTFACYRGMMGEWGPLLMAAGIGSIATFGTWKLWRLWRDPSVRLVHGQLKIKGRVTALGWAFVPCALGLLILGLWSGVVRFNRWWGGVLDYRVTTPAEVVFRPGYVPRPEDKAAAERAIAYLRRSDAIEYGGWGWRLTVEQRSRLAWLEAVAGDMDAAVRSQERLVAQQVEVRDRALVSGPRAAANRDVSAGATRLADFVMHRARLAGKDASDEADAILARYAGQDPGQGEAWLARARLAASHGTLDPALGFIEAGIKADESNAAQRNATAVEASELLSQLGRPDRAREVLESALAKGEASPLLRAKAYESVRAGRLDEARSFIARWTTLAPHDPAAWLALVEIDASMRNLDQALASAQAGQAKLKHSAPLRLAAGNVLLAMGKSREAREEFERALALDKTQVGAWIALARLDGTSNPAQAEARLRVGLHHLPTNGQLRAALVDVLVAAGQTEPAAFEARRGGELDPWTPYWPQREAELWRALKRDADAKAADDQAKARQRALGMTP